MINLHSLGGQLTLFDTEKVSKHEVALDQNGVLTQPFMASSPPIGHALLTDGTGSFAITEHDRVFFWAIENGVPLAGDDVVDLSDDSKWRVVRGPDEAAWSYHGQHRDMIKVLTKKQGDNN